MTQVYKSLVVLLAIICCASSAVYAQPSDEPEHHGKEKIKQRIEDYRKVRLIELLSLEGAQLEKFFGVYNKNQEKVRSAKQDVDNAAKACREAVKDNASETVVKTKSNQLLSAMIAFEQAINTRHTEAQAILTPHQFATYLAFEASFMEELQRMVLQRGMKKGMR